MLKTLFGGSHDAFGKAALDSGKIDLDRIRTLIEFFPIGRKLRYYPEFNQDIVLDTLVVAYGVNGHFLYSMESIETDRDGQPAAFRANGNALLIPAARLDAFKLLVPDTSDLEMKLDYVRRARIGRNGQFCAGNSITLISNTGRRGISTLETEVDRPVLLHDGPYAGRTMILLTPELATLSVTDQRKKPRTRLNVPVTVSLPSGDSAGPCTILDISEAELRVSLDERAAVREGSAMTLDICLKEAERNYSVNGTAVRRSAGTCVVELNGQTREGRFVPFTPLDLLELKAGLLNYGEA